MRRFFLLRRGEIERVADFFKDKNNKRVIWFHSASAGELEQAKPVIEHIKNTNGKILIAASFFSPSGFDAGLKYDKIDFCFNLPLDRKKTSRSLLRYIDPVAIIFSKYDIWTNLAVEASRSGVKLLLISGTLPESSFRHRFPLKYFFRKSYSLFNGIYAISDRDAERFSSIIKPEREKIIHISGDTRFDRIKEVARLYQDNPKSIIKREKGILYLTMGSTYPVSEKMLLKTIKWLKKKHTNVKYILVPHEVDSHNIDRITRFISKQGLNPVLYSSRDLPVQIGHDEILIVDVMGVLALLYDQSDIVFIGGSYKGSVHSILEPAVFGKPILTGPHIRNSYEAMELNKEGGLLVCKNKGELFKNITKLIIDRNFREYTSNKSKDFFRQRTGAVDKIISGLNEIIP